jgi:hypothetical protein
VLVEAVAVQELQIQLEVLAAAVPERPLVVACHQLKWRVQTARLILAVAVGEVATMPPLL